MKILALSVLAGILCVGVLLVIGPRNVLQRVWIALSEDTAYAPGYSEQAFRKIVIGDREADVRAALGAPLSESATDPYTAWLYAPAPDPAFAATGNAAPSVSYTVIRFGEDGRFDGARGQVFGGSMVSGGNVRSSGAFGNGMNSLSLTDAAIAKLQAEQATPEQIEARFGKPRAIFVSRAATWLRFSRSPGSKNYRLRMIGIDRDGKVCRKRSEIYWD